MESRSRKLVDVEIQVEKGSKGYKVERGIADPSEGEEGELRHRLQSERIRVNRLADRLSWV